MNKIELNKEQRTKLLEMCNDLFPEYIGFYLIDGVIGYNDPMKGDKGIDLCVHWFELCMLELPRRIAENGPSVLTDSTHYRIYESMSKRFLNIHPTYDKVECKHPIDYLYQEFEKI